MSGLTKMLIGWAAFGPCVAPVPPAPAPSPAGKGYLGIYFVQTGANDSLAVGEVLDRMPAARAGLAVGDVIVRVNTLRPKSTQEMIDHVKTYRPGAVVEVEVRRGGEPKTFRVKLAARPDDIRRVTPQFDELMLPRP